ncbi:MAG: arginine--tRNA ligase [bacterium]|nr:arginine--tRNA ligase [bacterium]
MTITTILQTIREQLCQQQRLLLPTAESLNFSLEKPPEADFGDFATNFALILFPQLPLPKSPKSPRSLAEEIAANLQNAPEITSLVEKITVAGAGFINFYLSAKVKQQLVVEQLSMSAPSIVDFGQQKEVLVEFSSPNIAKPFTIAHLRSTIIGAAVANLLETSGYKVYRDNHLGDWGTQFGKQLVALEKWGNLEEIENSGAPIKKLVDLYVRFHQEAEQQPRLVDEARETFSKLEKKDQNLLSKWQKIIDISMKEFDKIYSKLGIQFSENEGKGYGESFALQFTESVIDELRKQNLLKESQGAQIVEFAPADHLPPLIIVKNDGSSIYATRDLATDQFRRQKYGPEIIIINEVGKEQSLYFRQLYRVEELLGWFKPGQRIHVGHGLYRFKDRKMSTRKGEIIWLNDVLESVLTRVTEINPDLPLVDREKISLGAIKWNDLSREAASDIDFDLEQMLNLKGNSGAYLQYTTVRARSVLKKAENEVFAGFPLLQWWSKEKNADLKEFFAKQKIVADEMALLNQLLRYPTSLQMATEKLAPHILATYLYQLAQEFNNFYNAGKIGDNLWRLSLTKLTEMILNNGLCILGIQIPDKM